MSRDYSLTTAQVMLLLERNSFRSKQEPLFVHSFPVVDRATGSLQLGFKVHNAEQTFIALYDSILTLNEVRFPDGRVRTYCHALYGDCMLAF
jgi:hypothetical protein